MKTVHFNLPRAMGLLDVARPKGLLFFRFRLILALDEVILNEALPL